MAIYNVGTGSGSLVIDNKDGKYKSGDIIKVKSGKYTGFNISNFNISSGYVTIQNEGGVVEIVGSMQSNYPVCGFSNIKGINLSGNGTSSVDKGFYFHDNKYRMIDITGINGVLKNLTIQHCKFENIGDYTLYFYNLNTVYDGTDNTISSNLKFLNIEAINCNLIAGGGDISTMKGLLRGLEIANCYIHDAPYPGTFIYWGGVEDYDIHDNIINNINQFNNNHNGIFHLVGNGKFYNNKVTNHQGNTIRAWTVGFTPGKTVEIYNNIAYNSRKYSGFELQVPPYLSDLIKANPTKLFKVDAKLYNNTIGKMNTSRDWDGLILDLYNLEGGTLEYYNNLGFELYKTSGVPADMINNISTVKIIRSENNIYKASQTEAVEDTTSFRSRIPGIGANSTSTPTPSIYKNIALSKVFTKNDCGSNQTGSTVTYQVGVGKYSSTLSQEDANQKAQNDIDTNGQSYANINGTCSSIPTTIKTINIPLEDYNTLRNIIFKYFNTNV